MKRIIVFTLLGLFLGAPISGEAQILKKLKKKIERKAEKQIDKNIDKGLEKEDDKVEGKKVDSIPDKKGGKSKKDQQPAESQDPILEWAKYDFVPGDKVIFEDNLLGEENGEFPSRWDLVRGNAEVAKFGEDMVIMLRDGAPSIIPYFKSPQNDYLPEVFTIEFDLYYPGSGRFEAYLYDRKNQKSGSPTGYTYVQMTYNEMRMGKVKSTLPDKNINKSRWMHIAIAYTNGKLKAYMDETRLLNIPRLDFDPKGLTLYTYHAKNDNLYYVKNIRIAEGGVKYYDRFLQDGKIIVSGIRFDVNKATLKPESMGVINEIVKLMKQHPEIKFSVEGHTDSDGDTDFNQKLSEDRAHVVRNQLVSMGVNNERLTSKGFGETMPIDSNGTAEGKANNRRVEFVKISDVK